MKKLAALLGIVLALPATADVVHLKNGNAFEGVVSEVTADEVAIRLEFGEMRLSRSSVSRIDRTASPLGDFLEAWDLLESRPDAGAVDWLTLGRRARMLEMGSLALQAARRAAALDPDVEGLERLFADLGYVRDESLRRWVPYEDLMHRRGFVLERGQWVSREVLAARTRAAEAEARERRAEAREARLDQVVQLLALAQIERLEDDRERAAMPVVPYGAYPVASFPGYWPGYVGGVVVGRPGPVPPIHHPAPRPPGGTHGGRYPTGGGSPWSEVAQRQPGSIVPLQPTTPPPMSTRR